MDKFVIVYEPSLEHYMVEYLNSLRSVGVCARTYYQVGGNDPRRRIYLQNLLVSSEDTYICNTEQMTTDTWNSNTNAILNYDIIQRLFFMDYSVCNLAQLKLLPNYEDAKEKLRLYHLPYCYNKEEIEKLRKLLDSNEKVYDVGMIGVYEPRRMMILQQLRDAGLKVNAINCYGHNRDVEMSKCKVLVNVHIRHDYTIFEEIRCMRWWYCGVPVFSETSTFQELLDVGHYITWAPLETLASVVVDYIEKGVGGVMETVDEKIIEKIALGRKKSVEDTFKELEMALTTGDQCATTTTGNTLSQDYCEHSTA